MIPSHFHILHFPEIESTNNYAQSHLKELSLPTFIYADYQSNGRGQQNNVWHSEPQKNLLSTIVLPVYLPIQKQYYLSQWISLIIIEVLVQLGISQDLIKIKWPNDILVKTNDGYKKISGILIENNIDNQIITTIKQTFSNFKKQQHLSHY
jgi:BirA family biotin operon repressor/biotin-[acetyl-CoA-carboxylase] ligase